MKTRLNVFVTAIILLLLSTATVAHAAGNLPIVNIGIVIDGPWERHPDYINIFKSEITRMAEEEFDVRFPADQILNGNWSQENINRSIDRLLANPEIDMVLALGFVSSHEACKRSNLSKPVIAPFITDIEQQGIPFKNGTSGVNNLSYLLSFKGLDREIRTFKEIVSFERMVILVDGFHLKVFSANRLVEYLKSTYRIDVKIVAAENSAADVLLKLPAATQAVLISSLPRFSDNEFQKLIDGLIKKKLPSFSYLGRDEVESGILASIAPQSTLKNIARSTAINIQDIFRGEKAGNLPVNIDIGGKLAINMATAKAIDVSPTWKILTKAELLNEGIVKADRVLTLETVAAEVLSANLDLAAADRNVAAGEQSVRESRSLLLPQIDIGSQASVIDEDRAEASLGTQPERLWTGSAEATQLIYSDRVWTNYTVEKFNQTARIESRETLKLDLVQAATTAYLNVLRAMALQRVQKENLTLTRENLERARIRVFIGVAGPEEVYRWESEIAGSRQRVLFTESNTLDAMSALNRILNRPLSEIFIARESAEMDPLSFFKDKRFFTYIANPKNLNLFRDFLIREGLELSTELRQIDAAIAASERTITAARREFYIPKVAFKGNVTERFAKDGAGSSPPSTLPGLPTKDDTDWSAGVFLTLPLFNSGGKSAALQRTREELARLQNERGSAANRIEERVINAVNLIRASYPGIWLTRDAAVAAQKNLKLVTDSYARGIKSIIDLIDAHNQALVADRRAANAVYDFLIDIMNVQRSVSRFILFADENERALWSQKAADYFSAAGIKLEHQ